MDTKNLSEAHEYLERRIGWLGRLPKSAFDLLVVRPSQASAMSEIFLDSRGNSAALELKAQLPTTPQKAIHLRRRHRPVA